MAEGSCKQSTEPAVAVELRSLVQRAQGGDATALPRIREILDHHDEIWRHVGDLSALAERAWISVLAADNPLAIESMKRTLAEMRTDLAGEHPTRLERMLVDQVLACWMELKYHESGATASGPGSLELASFRLRRLESAQKRYLTAVRTLTEMRALVPNALAPSGAIKLHDPEPKRQKA